MDNDEYGEAMSGAMSARLAPQASQSAIQGVLTNAPSIGDDSIIQSSAYRDGCNPGDSQFKLRKEYGS